ncbi:N-acetyltransferase [Alteromonas sp. BL110]|uniref:GNAT family N-acetyltransferase n=1 Tax=Alteromonas sp. BL110 TaxID=1714845 RepID=UPI001E40DE4D|nr:GNAT family N-acetyltransferase [Alteromonas sp. BL110]
MKQVWYLNDLFVVQSARGKGVASALLEHVKVYAKENDSFSLKLATAIDNIPAKELYEKHGYSKVTAFDHYVVRTDMI